MFDMNAVRETVQARLKIIGRVDEAMMHELYAKAVYAELEKDCQQRNAAVKERYKRARDAVRVEHKDGKWVMVDREYWQAVNAVADAVVNGVTWVAGNPVQAE